MSRATNGCHMENKGWSWNWERELNDVVAPNGMVTLLDTLLTDVENGFWYPRLRASYPGVIKHIRMYPETGWLDPTYGRHWNDLEPAAWAAECVRRLTGVPGLPPWEQPLCDPMVLLSFANEQDLQREGHPEAGTWEKPWLAKDVYDEIWNWNADVVREFRRIASIVCLTRGVAKACYEGTNPLAGGHDVYGYPPDWEYQLPSFQAYKALGLVLLVHAYFNPDGSGAAPEQDGYWVGQRCLRPKGYREDVQGLPAIGGRRDPGGAAMQYPGSAFAVTEFGNFRHDDQTPDGIAITIDGYRTCYGAYSASGRNVGVTAFIWNCGEEHKKNRLWGNWPLVDALAALPEYPAADWPPAEEEPPMSLEEQYPKEFAEWKANGGVENNFSDHLLGIGSIPVTREAVNTLIENTKAKLAQLEGVVDSLPF